MKRTAYITAILLMGTLTMACSKEEYGDAPRDWDASSTYFASADDKGFNTYYTPAIGRVGDTMPFWDAKAGEYKVLYLQEFENNLQFPSDLGRFHEGRCQLYLAG